MSNPMKKTVKIGNKMSMKSTAVRCDRCNKLMRIEKLPPDDEVTEVKYITCYDCKKKIKASTTGNKSS